MAGPDRYILAEAGLLVWLAQTYETPAGPDGCRPAKEPFLGAVDVAQLLGLISPERAELLRELSERFDEPHGLDLATQARERMEHLLTRLAEERDLAFEAEESDRAFDRFEDALQALVDVGAIGPDEYEAWHRRGDGSDAPATDHGPGLLRLRAVIPGDPRWRNGIRVRAIECYEDGGLLRWDRRVDLPDELRRQPWSEMAFELAELISEPGPLGFADIRDDRGGDYRVEGWASTVEGGAPLVMRAGSRFSPGIPSDAKSLTVKIHGERFAFDVAGVGERPTV